jgi:hypothetical protein
MDARPVLATVARVLREQRLEAILIDNAPRMRSGRLSSPRTIPFQACSA